MGLFLMADAGPVAVLLPWLTKLVYFAEVIFGIGLVIFVHELGHFLAAKFCGVKVEKFYVGFDLPPWRLLGIPMPGKLLSFQRGETEYGIGIIPLGGYVKMLGQDDNPAHAEKEAERIRVREESPSESAAAESAAPVKLDPRSYPAKSVPQRMLIISAGIIMNLIFAVIFAAVAYRAGVEYMPTVIAGTSPGDPAWIAGLEPGDKILQIGRSGQPSEHLRFDKDLRTKVLTAGMGKEVPDEIPMLVRSGDAEPRWVELRPRRRVKDPEAPATVGVRPMASTTLGPVRDFTPAGAAKPALLPNDRIIAVNGAPLERSSATAAGDFPSLELEQKLAEHIDEPITLRVERSAQDEKKQEIDVTIAPDPRRWLGLTMEMGPVVAVRPGSAAAKAGFQVGDRITQVDGAPAGDPLTLGQRLADRATAGDLTFTVERGEGEKTETLTLTTSAKVTPTFSPSSTPGSYAGIDSLGLAYGVPSRVAAVEPNSPAAKKGLQPGDEIIGIKLHPRSAAVHRKALETYGLPEIYNEYQAFDSELDTWPYFDDLFQLLPPEIDIDVTFRRGKTEQPTVTLPLLEREDEFYVERGLNLQALERVHTAASLSEAMQLGYRETKERLTEVATVLGMLFTGRVSVSNLGGPIRIVAFAGSEAMVSMPRLLMFLTFLSANLALLNALPIPVLDGGHFMFLMLEGIFRRPVSERWQIRLTFVGFAFLMLLMAFVFFNDISWLFQLL